MKILCVVVLYNPSKQVVENVKTYERIADKVLFIDNSTGELPTEFNEFKVNEKFAFYSMNGNQGIAAALSTALIISCNEKFDYTLTMDQDTSFISLDINKIKSFLFENIDSNYAIIALDVEKKYKDNSIHRVKSIITSGNFINNRLYKKLDGFNEKLFIDYVDFDLCRQIFYKRFAIVVIPFSNAKHTIGIPKEKRFIFFKIKSYNHSYIRYYYRYRNELYLFKQNRKFYFKMHLNEKINYFKMLLCDDDVKRKIVVIRRAKNDAKKGILGKYMR